MNSARLLEYFDRIGEAPDAVPQLRRFVLDLAVRGKLVEQDPADEPASGLLKRIQAEKARLVKDETIRQRDAVPPVELDEHPFRIPTSWEWVRFGGVADFSAGRTPSRSELTYWNTGEFPWVSIADLKDGGEVVATKETVSARAKADVFASDPVAVGTLIMSFKLTIGKISRLGVSAFHNEAIIAIHPHLPRMDAYLFKVLPQFSRQGDTKDAIKGATLNRESITKILLPLPPLSEQHRIVAKVDELMALCDRLEAAQAERERRRDLLVVSSLDRLSQCADDDAGREGARFHLAHFSQLTTCSNQVPALRQTIVDLAVRGRLLPQDADDEPAEKQLVRIQAEKKLTAGRGGRDDSPSARVNDVPHDRFQVPSSWRWVALREVSLGLRYGTSIKCAYEKRGAAVLRIPNIKSGRISIDDLKYGDLPAKEADELRLQFGDILMVRSNGSLDLVGRPALVDAASVGYCYAGYLVRVRTNPVHCATPYLVLALGSTGIRDQIEIPIRTTVGLKNVNSTELGDLAFPLPPHAEQTRIVERVNELMALCDQLEAILMAAQAESRRLLDAVLHEALAVGA